jgi:hypothetical protein
MNVKSDAVFEYGFVRMAVVMSARAEIPADPAQVHPLPVGARAFPRVSCPSTHCADVDQLAQRR